MKLAACVAAVLAASASAFTSPSAARGTTALNGECVSKETILSEPNTIEFGQVWDPLKLSELGSDTTLAWFRHSEIKHGRVAMAAFVGWWATGSGLRWPGEIDLDGLKYADIPSKGLEAWDAIPGWGKAQIFLFIGFMEWGDEYLAAQAGEHYLTGGTPGKNFVPGLFDPLNFSRGKSEEKKARGRSAEIKNGRLAMLGVAGLYAAATIDGSVPLQPPC